MTYLFYFATMEMFLNIYIRRFEFETSWEWCSHIYTLDIVNINTIRVVKFILTQVLKQPRTSSEVPVWWSKK